MGLFSFMSLLMRLTLQLVHISRYLCRKSKKQIEERESVILSNTFIWIHRLRTTRSCLKALLVEPVRLAFKASFQTSAVSLNAEHKSINVKAMPTENIKASSLRVDTLNGQKEKPTMNCLILGRCKTGLWRHQYLNNTCKYYEVGALSLGYMPVLYSNDRV